MILQGFLNQLFTNILMLRSSTRTLNVRRLKLRLPQTVEVLERMIETKKSKVSNYYIHCNIETGITTVQLQEKYNMYSINPIRFGFLFSG